MIMITPITIKDDLIILQIYIQPKSYKTKWGEVKDNRYIQLKVTSPPVDGAANNSCIKFIAKEFKTAKSLVKITQGEKSRYKVIEVRRYDRTKLERFLSQYINK